MLNALSADTLNLSTAAGESAQAQFSTRDYGFVGDQRPYQIVMPTYAAPKFLSRFQYLDEALRECSTLCQLKGKPFRLVKWGSKVPCYPCKARKRVDRLPSMRLHTTGALEGYPEATPIADFTPNGTQAPVARVYGPDGQPKVVGGRNFIVTSSPYPQSELVRNGPLPQRYLEAVKTAQYLASTTGKNTFLCSSTGGDCNTRNPKAWVPVVYVQPGGLVRRYHTDLVLPNSPYGSQVATTNVTEDEFKELLRQSAGGSRMAWGT